MHWICIFTKSYQEYAVYIHLKTAIDNIVTFGIRYLIIDSISVHNPLNFPDVRFTENYLDACIHFHAAIIEHTN